MKIVIMNTVPYGSTGRIAQNIAKMARDEGNEVYLVNGWTKNKRRSQGEGDIIATNFFSKLLNLELTKMFGLDGCFSMISTLKMVEKLKRIKPDIVHLHIMHDSFLNLSLLFDYFREYNIRVVWTFHDCWTFTGGCPYFTLSKCEQWTDGCQSCIQNPKYAKLHRKAPKKMWQLKKKLTEYSNLWITTPSAWLASKVSKSIWNEHECFVIRNGLNLKLFRHLESDFRRQYQCEDKQIVLGVAFDWGERKGLDVFNELANLLPLNYQIVLVGTNDKIDAQLNKKVISIHKTGNQEELVKIYSASDVFVNPTKEEVFGMVNIEAVACGTPVITFDTDGAPEGINEECGIVVKDKTAKGLVPVIVDVCERRKYNMTKMREWVKNFDEQKCYKEYLELYGKLMNIE